MTSGLRVLITNHALAVRDGATVYVRDLVLGLLARGHTPLAYSPLLGGMAEELRALGVPVVDDLNQLPLAPDVIHGHQHMDTMTALLHFPAVPAIFLCHSALVWYDQPFPFPRILRYVAVDAACRDRLASSPGVPHDRIRVLLNFVDLARFKARQTPLPSRPQRALVFSNYANSATHLPIVREACKRRDLALDVIGSGVGKASSEPEMLLGQYDLIFAKARCALEALAVGAAVVLCDERGVGPMVTTVELERLRSLNFGLRTLSSPLDATTIVREIDRYDREDAAAVSKTIRATAGSDQVIDQLIELYVEVIREYKSAGNGSIAGDGSIESEGRAAAAYLRQLKLDFAAHGAASMRLRETIRRIPVLGRWGVRLAQKIVGRPH